MNKKLKRIRSKPITNIDRAKLRAAKRAKTRKTLNAATAQRMADAVPEFLKIGADEYRVPPVFQQPDIVPSASGLLIHRKYTERDYVPRDRPRLGIMLCLLSAACVLAVAVKLTGAA